MKNLRIMGRRTYMPLLFELVTAGSFELNDMMHSNNSFDYTMEAFEAFAHRSPRELEDID